MREYVHALTQYTDMIVVDNSDTSPATIQMYMQTSWLTVADVPYRFMLDDSYDSGWLTYKFKGTNARQLIRSIYVSTSTKKLQFHIGYTGYTALGGPGMIEIDIIRGLPKVYVTEGNVPRMAIPYVCIEPGVWLPAEGYVQDAEGWKLAQ